MKSKACVLVVHCVDAEGPLGGNARRRPDGSKEFMDNWADIKRSLREITSDNFREKNKDSFNNPYIFNWFIMDFTGFKTNPKERICEYNNTYDNIKSLNTKSDGFYWHYHQPPKDGRGDQWSDSWDSSDEHLNILLHRLMERNDFPEAIRLGGTIEDNKCSLWLEDNIMLDYSNRASDRSYKTDNIFDFNWFGASSNWGYYHPDPKNFLKKGKMRRYIAKCLDLRSRLHELREFEVKECFQKAKEENKPVILSFFSHDHRDMREETRYGIGLIKKVAKAEAVPWRICSALEAVQICDKIKPAIVNVQYEIKGRELNIIFDKEIYQRFPYVGVRDSEGGLSLLPSKKSGKNKFKTLLPKNVKNIFVGGTSLSGNKFVKKIC